MNNSNKSVTTTIFHLGLVQSFVQQKYIYHVNETTINLLITSGTIRISATLVIFHNAETIIFIGLRELSIV